MRRAVPCRSVGQSDLEDTGPTNQLREYERERAAERGDHDDGAAAAAAAGGDGNSPPEPPSLCAYLTIYCTILIICGDLRSVLHSTCLR